MNCLLCNRPMKISKGKPVHDDEDKFLFNNHDQVANFHKACRKQGRKLVREGKLSIEFVGRTRKWFAGRNKYGNPSYSGFWV